MALYIVREGHGEQEALPALVYSLKQHLELDLLPHHSVKRHGLRLPLLTEAQVKSACERVAASPDCNALLLTRDADQDQLAHADCPKYSAPAIAGWVRELNLPFPVAVILFYKEYETLFVAGAATLAGSEIRDNRSRVVGKIPAGVTPHPDPEQPRDAKGWVATNLVTKYKPTLHQTLLTKLLDHNDMTVKELSSYRRLISGLQFLAGNLEQVGAVYPPTPIGGP